MLRTKTKTKERNSILRHGKCRFTLISIHETLDKTTSKHISRTSPSERVNKHQHSQ